MTTATEIEGSEGSCDPLLRLEARVGATGRADFACGRARVVHRERGAEMSDEFDDLQPEGAVRDRLWRGRGQPMQQLSRIPELIADVYRSATAPLRVKLLECLLLPVGPLGLVAIAAGAFGDFLQRGSYVRLAISPEDAARISADQMLELARFVEQSNPETFQRIASLLADKPIGVAGLGGSLLLIALQAWRSRGSTPET